ncbi:hypothetical protein SO802_017428 [Lithocarpus litseifolius]|uniref:Uncharacterized protein n=1 Tax=Lithocarpus litseifolius TaxID=425828 RepID=A0AAW2CLA7_9ROSI
MTEEEDPVAISEENGLEPSAWASKKCGRNKLQQVVFVALLLPLQKDTRVYEKIDCVVGSFSVSVLLKGVADGFVWICTGVYGLNDVGLRDALWAELDSVRAR